MKKTIDPKILKSFIDLVEAHEKLSYGADRGPINSQFHDLLNPLTAPQTYTLVIGLCDLEPDLAQTAMTNLKRQFSHLYSDYGYHKDPLVAKARHYVFTIPTVLHVLVSKRIPVKLWREEGKEFFSIVKEFAENEVEFDWDNPRYLEWTVNIKLRKSALTKLGYDLFWEMGM